MSRRGENIHHRKDGLWEARYVKEANIESNAQAKVIDPFEFVLSVSYDGYNTNGVAHVDFDKTGFVEQLIGEEPTNDYEATKYLLKFDSYYTSIDYNISPNETLSNGDTITVVFETTHPNIKLKQISKEYIVSGLPELKSVDLFSGIDITVEGMSGRASVSIIRDPSLPILSECTFEINPQFKVSSGDEITITLSTISQEYLLSEYYMIPKERTMKYTAPKLASYISSSDQLDSEVIRAFSEQFFAKIQEEYKGNMFWTYNNFEYYGTFLFIGKASTGYADSNYLEFVVAFDEYKNGEFIERLYLSLQFRNIIINADGSMRINYNDGYTTIFSMDGRELNYDIIKLSVLK